ncbi:MAG: CYTH domain-containing protein [Minisyncoccota bacterium]
MRLNMEIEKKYKLNKLPDNLGVGVHIIQGYLIDREYEVRIRKKGDRYLLTYKSGGTLSRKEIEIRIPKFIFKILWSKTEGRRIEKIRYSKPLSSGLVLEFDEYFRPLKGLITLEVEFSDEDSANNFMLPEYIQGIDITTDMKYKNKNLAINGLPK